MLGICLLVSSVLLFLGGINYFINIDKKILGILNLTVAVVLTVLATFSAITASYAAAAATYMFAINYTILGLHYLISPKNWKLFGWFAFFAAVFSLICGVHAAINSDFIMLFLWFMWTELWVITFLDSACNIKWSEKFAPYNLILNAIVSTGMPAMLILLEIIL